MHAVDLPGFALAPRSVARCVEWLCRAGSPLIHHENWQSRKRLGPRDFGVAEHLTLATIPEDLMCAVGLDLTNLVGAERIFRKMQMLEHHYEERYRDKYDSNRMPQEEVDASMGGHVGNRPVAMVCPLLIDDISRPADSLVRPCGKGRS